MNRKRAGNILGGMDQPERLSVQKWCAFQCVVDLLCFHSMHFFFSSANANFCPINS